MRPIRSFFACTVLILVLGCGSLGPTTDGNAPVVQIVSPANGAMVGRQVTIEANAIDDFGVDKVRFLVDGDLLAQLLSPPYRVTWGNGSFADGTTHTIKVEAYDVAKNFSFDQVTVTISVAHGAP
jgi:Big-like domain-containing protein